MRKAILRIHLFLSLILGVFIVTTCTTGSLLMLEPTIERWMDPIDRTPTPGDVGVAVIKQHGDAVSPDLKTDRIDFPAEDGFYHVHLSKADADGKEGKLVYADPGTGEIFGQVAEEHKEPFQTIYNLHRYFLLTPVIGKQPAAWVVGILGVGMLIILLTGAYLWWPGIRKLANGFRIVRNRGKLLYNMGLHKTIGIISIPALLVFAGTGVINAFEKSIPVWVGFKAKEEVPKSAMAPKQKNGTILPVDQIVSRIHQSYPNSKLVSIQIPLKPGQNYRVGLKEGFGASEKSNSTVYIDAADGEVLYKTNPNLAINLYNAWRKGLHSASWGGEELKWLSFLFGMTPLALMITGIVIWQWKARARRRGNKPDTKVRSPLSA